VFLIPQGISHFQSLPLDVKVEAPFGWPVWGSWPRHGDTFAPPTLHDLWSGVAAGGNFHPSRLEAGSVSVVVLAENSSASYLASGIGNRLLKALGAMHGLFGAAPRGEEMDVLAVFRVFPPRGLLSLMTGNSEESAFLCLATPDRYRNPDALTALAVHECLHFYLGGAVAASPEPPYRNAPDVIWFMEGMTEYLTYRLMEETGILGEETFEDVSARKRHEYDAAHAARGLSLAEAARRMGDPDVYSLVYTRGFLVAELLDETAERECGPGTLDAALRLLFETHSFYRGEHAVSHEVVREVLVSACPELGDLIDRYAAGDAELPPPTRLP
jgi:predicted metalloprotease with PDZ domain